MRIRTAFLGLAALSAAGLSFFAACNRGDQVAPEGATIGLAATPATIVKIDDPDCIGALGVSTCGTAEIVATVSSVAGVPLSDQDVRFTSTAGLLFTGTLGSFQPANNVPIRTDDFGNAHVTLAASGTTTVNARSGKATGSLNLIAVAGNISQIVLNVDTTSAGCSSSTVEIGSCSQEVCLEAQVLDNNGVGLANIVVLFELQNNTVDSNTFEATFTPPQPTTKDDPGGIDHGKAFTVLKPKNNCPTECGGGKACRAEVVATLQGGVFPSTPLVLTVDIP